MEDKIEVGEYVRTKRGIAKVTNIDSLDNVAWTDRKDIFFGVTRESGYLDWYIYDDGTVLKHSKNIIDLIEVNDYVNGYKVISVDRDVINKNIDCIELDLNNNYQYNFISINQIKSIVTREQFSSIEYKITKED